MSEKLNEEIIRRFNEMHRKQHLQISDLFAKSSISLKLISNDLLTITSCLNKLKTSENLEEIIINSLWTNIIITYGKIFTVSKYGFRSLVKKQCIKIQYEQIHDKLIDLRNKFVAHRENNEIENPLLLVAENRTNGKVGFEYYIPIVIKKELPIEDFSLFEELIADLNNYIDEKLQKNLEKIDKKLWAEISKNKI